ncbi:MAG: hypothetical protein ACUVX8_09085 [Candidatus Zipacnadales bacterium]
MKRRFFITTAVTLGAFLWAEGVMAEKLTYVDILKQLTDFDRLARLQTGIAAGQFSSHSRADRERWATNADAGHYLRVTENGEAVMMEQEGPGCIYRMWSANPQGKLLIYLDGATTPTFVLDHNGLYTDGQIPFIKPLVYKRGEARSASDSYVPIPFGKSIKICADKPHPQFYIFDYLKYPKDWEVESFHLPLTEEEIAVLEAVAETWAKCGSDPKPRLSGQRTVMRTLTLKPGQTVRLAHLKGPGSVRAIRMRVDCPQRSFWRKLVLEGGMGRSGLATDTRTARALLWI